MGFQATRLEGSMRAEGQMVRECGLVFGEGRAKVEAQRMGITYLTPLESRI